jgi:hypothetical protein
MSDDPLIRKEPAVGAKGDVPVLTEVVNEEITDRRAVDDAALEALARALERAVLERMAPELERIVGEALAGARSELKDSVTQMVREAVAASVAFALRPKKPE